MRSVAVLMSSTGSLALFASALLTAGISSEVLYEKPWDPREEARHRGGIDPNHQTGIDRRHQCPRHVCKRKI